MIYRIVASILLLVALAALAYSTQNTGTQPAAATAPTPSGATADDNAMKALKLN